MSLPDRLLPFTTPTPVLNDGHVQLIDVMGDDRSIIDAARVSFFGSADASTDESNRHLLRYLMRCRHTTPFEMCELKIRVRVPMDAWRQWIRHRTANVNESSTRYAPAIDSAQKATEWRSQSKDNKQGSSGVVTDWPEDMPANIPGEKWNFGGPVVDESTGAWAPDGTFFETPSDYLSTREGQAQAFAREVYEERLAFGVAKEVARKDLPLSTYTEAYWKMDLHNLFHFLSLRLDPHAQKEIRSYAETIAEIVKVWVPWAWEAFEDYRLQGMYLSRFDVDAIREILVCAKDQGLEVEALKDIGFQASGLGKGREKAELLAKLDKLLGE
jgi:thymidylate synthase (FAD)